MTLTIIPAQDIDGSSFVGRQWRRESSTANASRVYGSSYLICDTRQMSGEDTVEPPRLDLSFIGTGVEFMGRYSSDSKLRWSVDGEETMWIDLSADKEGVGKDGAFLFAANNPKDFDRVNRQHNVTIWPYEGVLSLDFIIVLKSPESLTQTIDDILIDNGDAEFGKFTGDWRTTSMNPELSFRPLHFTWSESRTKGAYVNINFNGTSITLRGPVHHAPGILKVKYVLDGDEASAVVTTHFNSSEQAPDAHWTNQALYTSPPFPTPGYHSLRATVEEITESQSFNLDFLVYTGYARPQPPPSSSPPPGWTPPRPPLVAGSPGMITGVVIGSVVVALLLWLGISRHKATKARRKATQLDSEGANGIRLHNLESTNFQRVTDAEGPSAETAPPPWSPPSTLTSGLGESIQHSVESQNPRSVSPPPPAFDSITEPRPITATSNSAASSPLPSNAHIVPDHASDSQTLPALHESSEQPSTRTDPPPYSGTTPRA